MSNKLTIIALSVLVVLAVAGLALKNSFSSPQTGPKDRSSDVGASRSEIKVGDVFPDFTITEVSGRTITRESLKGKPAIIWFTASWCVPCQIGAREVSRLDNELGGNAFNVVVIFVDPREKDVDLINWRKNFANSDWEVAFDNQSTTLATRAGIKALDSKFILDKDGAIKNIDFKQADENYLNAIKQAVK